MSIGKLTLLSVVLCCASWVAAQTAPAGGAAPAGGSGAAGQSSTSGSPATPPSGTATPPCQSRYAARGHSDSARRNGDSARGDRHASSRDGNPSNRATKSERSGLCLPEHDSEPKYARIYLSRNTDSRQHHTTFHNQSEHTEYSRQLAQRFSMWNSARRSEWLAGFSTQRRVVNDQPINPGKRKQSGFHWRYHAGCDSYSRQSVSTGRRAQRKHECASRVRWC
jgi:hypothetical protein